MDIIEQLARQAAETINGGEFYDGKWYTEGQRQAWRRAMTPAADEIKRLRQQNAELNQKIEDLVESLEWIANRLESNHTVPSEAILARNAIAKATGG